LWRKKHHWTQNIAKNARKCLKIPNIREKSAQKGKIGALRAQIAPISGLIFKNQRQTR
jgi:hypothetical protein